MNNLGRKGYMQQALAVGASVSEVEMTPTESKSWFSASLRLAGDVGCHDCGVARPKDRDGAVLERLCLARPLRRLQIDFLSHYLYYSLLPKNSLIASLQYHKVDV